MDVLYFLLLAPLIAAVLLYVLPDHPVRDWLVRIAAVVIAGASVYLLATAFNKGTQLVAFPTEPLGYILEGIGLLVGVVILALAVKYRKPVAIVLALVQIGLLLWFTAVYSPAMHAEHNLFVDEFSIVMALIIGIIGSAICAYAVPYMRTFHAQHPEVPDRRRMFFFILFAFLSAMFGIVFSNNLGWFLAFWEVTTFCSFVLIGYTRTKEAIDNAFLAVILNLVGGIGFALALLWLGMTGGSLELDKLVAGGAAVALVPATLIGFAGLTKAAQLPFSSWLLGAMVAPTPVSALLHSSTMVKAGVYAIVKFAPVLANTLPGLALGLVGGVTFLLASAMAVTQSNAKRILAYSTVANLGLVVACGGIGTYEAVWAAILLIIFHAVAKSLLFLGVGTVEHQLHSRDVEDMAGLLTNMPRVGLMMLIGMAGMYLAPLGMLISKWATLRAFIDAPGGVLFVILVAFGSAVTVFFWAKWMGLLIARPNRGENIEARVPRDELAVLGLLAALVVGVSILFPWISQFLLEPYVFALYGKVAQLGQSNIVIMLLMMGTVLLLPASLLYFRKGRHMLKPYMGGRPTTDDMRFAGSLGIEREMGLHNYYLEDLFSEPRTFRAGVVVTVALIVLMFAGLALAGGLA
ncbi:MAG: proton-conducting transporter membrane subunit [Methanospirillum sp.]